MRYELKRISPESVHSALEKADKYRLLNQPDHAESIARDVLDVSPDSVEALKQLGLALTDQFSEHPERFRESLEVFGRISDPYERTYLLGIAYERICRARLLRDSPKNLSWLVKEALAHYVEAERLRPPGNDEARLRWNSMVRLMERHPELEPKDPDPHHHEGEDTLDFGDAPPF